jgi:hypothetical protein
MPPTELPTPPSDPSLPPAARPTRTDHDQESLGETQANVAGMMVGTALIFVGFLNVFLSISGGFEINAVPLVLYFAGIAVWANSVVENPTTRYSIMAAALLFSLGFFHYGEVLFWHKQVVFWSTVVVVMWFMFREPKRNT